MGAWSELYRSDGGSKNAPHNLSITKAQAQSRIFGVKQFEYTLFGGILLSGRSLLLVHLGPAALGCPADCRQISMQFVHKYSLR